MQLVSLQIRGIIAINVTFSLRWRYYGLKGEILDYMKKMVYYPIISYWIIKNYSFETMHMIRFHL